FWAPTPRGRRCDGVSRRNFLRIGALGLSGLTWADLQLLHAAADAPQPTGRTKSIVYLFLDGGASQLETFDPKVDVPAEYRSIFGAIQTRLPGVQFGSQFPLLAGVADQMSIVRTLGHTDGDHGGATHWLKTGNPWPPQFLGQAAIIPQQHPAMGSVVARRFGATQAGTGVPSYVRVMGRRPGYPGDDAAWLGASYAPLRCRVGQGNELLDDMELRIDRARLDERSGLLESLDQWQRRLEAAATTGGVDEFRRQALHVVLGSARQAFDLSQEDERCREAYGPGLGQDLLLARRLCERGSRFVTINFGNWDHHGDIVPKLQDACPPLDHAVHAFLQDVQARGLFQDILLVVTGDFGRTPRINDRAGRDHWAAINDVLFLGGGLKTGQVVGETDEHAGTVKSRPVSVQDLMATLFHALGIERDLQYVDPSGRPRSMVESGEPIRELF
ncbi:MAG: DUF1501 domain-containing protein, partial [Pirellulaceae bacterium]